VDEVASEGDFIIGNAECDFVERDFHQSSPRPTPSCRQAGHCEL